MQSSRPDVFAQENGTGKTVETDHQLPEPKYEKILNFIYRSYTSCQKIAMQVMHI